MVDAVAEALFTTSSLDVVSARGIRNADFLHMLDNITTSEGMEFYCATCPIIYTDLDIEQDPEPHDIFYRCNTQIKFYNDKTVHELKTYYKPTSYKWKVKSEPAFSSLLITLFDYSKLGFSCLVSNRRPTRRRSWSYLGLRKCVLGSRNKKH